MQILHTLIDVRAAALIGRDPVSLVMDVLDDTMQDDLQTEMDALSALAASHAFALPFGPTRVMTIEMAPMLCSLVHHESDIPALLAFVHDWIVGLGDVRRTAREVHAAMQEARLVIAEHGELDSAKLLTLPDVDQEAIGHCQELLDATSSTRTMGGWSIDLVISDHRTLAAMLSVEGKQAVIGVCFIDDEPGPRIKDRTPLLVA